MIADSHARLLLTIVLSRLTSAPAAGAREDPDVERALAAARVRAAAGDVVAQFSLGAILYYGGSDTAQAIEWFRKAAAQGYAPAEFQMGQLYDFGFGVAQDDREALELVPQGRRARQRRRRSGRSATSTGRDAASPPTRRRPRAGTAAPPTATISARNINSVEMYFDGTGVPRDYASAYLWFSLAAGQAPLDDNRKGLLELRNIAAARMTPEQVAEAARRVAAWKPTPGR